MREKKLYVVGRMLQYLEPNPDGVIGYIEIYKTKRDAKRSAGKTYPIWVIEINDNDTQYILKP